MPKQPKFTLFITDQHRADYLGCIGHLVLETPHIDAIAEGGTMWNRFYVASPVCMPNRASFMTCRMPSSHGVRSNGIPLDRRNVTFVDLLREAGHKAALIGKSHLQPFPESRLRSRDRKRETAFIALRGRCLTRSCTITQRILRSIQSATVSTRRCRFMDSITWNL